MTALDLVFATMDLATAKLASPELIAQEVLAPMTALVTETVFAHIASARLDGLDSTAHSKDAHETALHMVDVLMESAIALLVTWARLVNKRCAPTVVHDMDDAME